MDARSTWNRFTTCAGFCLALASLTGTAHAVGRAAPKGAKESAARDEVAQLRRDLRNAERRIATRDRHIAQQDARIATGDERVVELEARIAEMTEAHGKVTYYYKETIRGLNSIERELRERLKAALFRAGPTEREVEQAISAITERRAAQ
jgi:hypothetical protein